jgi:hypothetical protein
MTATDDPGKLIDEARRLRSYAEASRSLIAVLRVAPDEVAIERRTGVLGWLPPSRSKPQPAWESIPGLENGVLQDALFVVRDRYETEAQRIEARLIVQPKETP